MSWHQYNPPLINILTDVTREELKKVESYIIQRVAEELDIAPKMVSGEINLSDLKWKTRGSTLAKNEDDWAWAFAYTRDGAVRPEARRLIEAVKRHGSVRVGCFEIKLGGRDGRLLNRTKIYD